MIRYTAILYIFLGLGLMPELWAHQVAKRVRVARAGVTIVTGATGTLNVLVRIRTRPPRMAQKGARPESSDESRCPGPVSLCSFVESVEIMVRGKAVEVPLSAFCDLADVNYAELAVSDKSSTLTLNGGDASTSYVVKIEFDQRMVRHRTVAPGEFEDQLLQETTYYDLPPLGE